MSQKGYTDKTALENYTLQMIDETFDTQIDEWIEAVEDYIDKQTGRNFIADSAASERLYDGNGECEMEFDDFVELSSLAISDTAISTDDLYQYPANELPKRIIRLKYNYFTKDYQNIGVTAKWGYSVACPADIKFAATVFLAGIVNYSNDAKGKEQSKAVGVNNVTFKDEKGWQDFDRAQKILDNYKKFDF